MPGMSEFKPIDVHAAMPEFLYSGKPVHGSRHGGSVAEAIQPLIRKFPNEFSKRKLALSITRFYGVGRHYHVMIEEEKNPVLCEEDGEVMWLYAWDDPELNGIGEGAKFSTRSGVEHWVKDITGGFSSETHEFVWSSFSEDKQKWLYKEGD